MLRSRTSKLVTRNGVEVEVSKDSVSLKKEDVEQGDVALSIPAAEWLEIVEFARADPRDYKPSASLASVLPRRG